MKRIQIVAATIAALAVLSGGALYSFLERGTQARAAAAPQAMPVPVAVID